MKKLPFLFIMALGSLTTERALAVWGSDVTSKIYDEVFEYEGRTMPIPNALKYGCSLPGMPEAFGVFPEEGSEDLYSKFEKSKPAAPTVDKVFSYGEYFTHAARGITLRCNAAIHSEDKGLKEFNLDIFKEMKTTTGKPVLGAVGNIMFQERALDYGAGATLENALRLRWIEVKEPFQKQKIGSTALIMLLLKLRSNPYALAVSTLILEAPTKDLADWYEKFGFHLYTMSAGNHVMKLELNKGKAIEGGAGGTASMAASAPCAEEKE